MIATLSEPKVEIDEDQVRQYQADGCTLVRGLCSPEEIGILREAIDEAVAEMSAGTPALEERNTYGKAFLQCTNLWERSDLIREFSWSARFGAVAARLTGAEAVRLYHDQALFKEPRGGLTPWHQDQGYWPLQGWGPLTMWMPLVDITAEMGGSMTFLRGSCHQSFEDFPISDHSQEDVESSLDVDGIGVVSYGPMAAGDATFHAGWTLHRANANPTDQMRSVMTVIFFPDGMVLQTPVNDRQERDLERWFPGCRAGDRAASPLNPVLRQRS